MFRPTDLELLSHPLDCPCPACMPPASGPAIHPADCTCEGCDPDRYVDARADLETEDAGARW